MTPAPVLTVQASRHLQDESKSITEAGVAPNPNNKPTQGSENLSYSHLRLGQGDCTVYWFIGRTRLMSPGTQLSSTGQCRHLRVPGECPQKQLSSMGLSGTGDQ